MKIAVYTLTRERLEYTKTCFQSLWDLAGMDFDWYIVDNGSQDGTQEWLKENEDKFTKAIYNDENLGISKASNQALESIFSIANQEKGIKYDLIIKFDNDCKVLSGNILGQIAEIYSDIKQFACKYVLSPHVEKINSQPERGRFTQLSGRKIGLTAIVGGIFHIVPAEIYKQYRYPEDLPKAKGQDDGFCDWVKKNGGEVGYIEGLSVEHIDGCNIQCQKFPEYFKRKFDEEIAR